MLRDYQQNAVDAALAHMRATKEPGIVIAATGAGKSHIIASLAETVTKAGKRTLVLAHNSDLIDQNAKKYRATGHPCSIFSAKLKKKHTGHPVIFGTRDSVARNLDKFTEPVALIIIDEAHLVGESEDASYQRIFAHFMAKNPNLRIMGLTATPSRGSQRLINDNTTFKHTIYEIGMAELIKLGWLVPVTYGVIHSDHYDTSGLKLYRGQFRKDELAAIGEDKERLTRSIIGDVIHTMDEQGRKCCMVFASSVKHAKEIGGYIAAHGKTYVVVDQSTKDRPAILEEARQGKIQYLVNVGTLTTGTDLPIVDCIAILRAIDSLALFQQIAGRGVRLYGGNNYHDEEYQSNPTAKMDCLLMDYGENVDRFGELDDDLLRTLKKAKSESDEEYDGFYIDCPVCKTPNTTNVRRCIGVDDSGARCEHLFEFKVCEPCGTKNSLSARYCRKCEAELIDPNSKLTRNAATAPGTPRYVNVVSMSMRKHYKAGKESLRIEYDVTDGERDFSVNEFLSPNSENWFAKKKFKEFAGRYLTIDEVLNAEDIEAPARLLIKRDKGSKYFSVISRASVDTLATS